MAPEISRLFLIKIIYLQPWGLSTSGLRPNMTPSVAIRYITLLFFVSVLAGCKKKYPDGPLLNFSSKLMRVSGDWVLSAAFINGEGKMSYTGFSSCRLKITDDKGYLAQWEEKNLEMNALGTWKWEERKKYISFSIDLWFYKLDDAGRLMVNTFNNSQLTERKYRILKLTDDQLWMEHTSASGNHAELHFKPAD